MIINYIEIIKREIKNFIDVFSPLITSTLVVSISLAVLQPYMASKHQIYNDIILENTALSGTNKSGEILSFWISLFLGILSMGICTILKKDELKNFVNKSKEKSQDLDFLGIGLFLVPIILLLFLTQKTNIFYWNF